MMCEGCSITNQRPNCNDCATRLLNKAGYLWNGTFIPDSLNPRRRLRRTETNSIRREINRNQRFSNGFVSLDELDPGAKIFVPGCA